MIEPIFEKGWIPSDAEARVLVDTYYQFQGYRKDANLQIGAIQRGTDEGNPRILEWIAAHSEAAEKVIAKTLDAYSAASPLGEWARSHVGVGPIIASGLLSNLSFVVNGQRLQTVGSFWRFAGMDPSVEWKKGEKRPWNARLKALMWNLGECFKRTHNHEDAFYGKLYEQAKALYEKRNEAGEYAEAAAAALKKKPNHKQAKTYKDGKLPKGHIDMRATRWVRKMFLSHYHQVGYFLEFGEQPPAPYSIGYLGHGHMIEAPNAPWGAAIPVE